MTGHCLWLQSNVKLQLQKPIGKRRALLLSLNNIITSNKKTMANAAILNAYLKSKMTYYHLVYAQTTSK